MIMWVVLIGVFGVMAVIVGVIGVDVFKSLVVIMIAFYLTCIVFVFGVLGTLLWFAVGVNIFTLLCYFGCEFLLILLTSSSETVLFWLIVKMEHLGVLRPVVGVVVFIGYSFNLDGMAIYLMMLSLFVAQVVGKLFVIGAQILLLVFMIIASKGVVGVIGVGLVTLVGGLQSHWLDLVDGVGLIVGIDRFMFEVWVLTNFVGNVVVIVFVGGWMCELDHV